MIEPNFILRVSFPCGCQPITINIQNDYFGNSFIWGEVYRTIVSKTHSISGLEAGDCIPELTVDGNPVAFFAPSGILQKLFIKGIGCDLQKLLAVERNPETSTRNASPILDGNLKVIL